jgi:hypothetical protein
LMKVPLSLSQTDPLLMAHRAQHTSISVFSGLEKGAIKDLFICKSLGGHS